MSTTEPTAEEIREALSEGAAYLKAGFEVFDGAVPDLAAAMKKHSDALNYIRDVLLADPDRVLALLALTYDDLIAAGANAYDGGSRTRCFAACNLHPDAKGGAK